MAQLFPGLTGLLLVSLRHASSLGEKIGEDAEVGKQDERDHPEHLGEPGHVMSAEQVTCRNDEQPEPQYEHEYCERVSDEIGKGESAFKEHSRSSRPARCVEVILDQCGGDSQRRPAALDHG